MEKLNRCPKCKHPFPKLIKKSGVSQVKCIECNHHLSGVQSREEAVKNWNAQEPSEGPMTEAREVKHTDGFEEKLEALELTFEEKLHELEEQLEDLEKKIKEELKDDFTEQLEDLEKKIKEELKDDFTEQLEDLEEKIKEELKDDLTEQLEDLEEKIKEELK
jgi:t-SNARE complex subunit (syntaxin)